MAERVLMEESNEETMALVALRDLSERLLRRPTKEDIEADLNSCSVSYYEQHWGNVITALRTARATEFYRNMPRTGTDESDRRYLIRRLREKAQQLGFTPRLQDIADDETMPHYSMYQYHFITWAKAIKAAGLSRGKRLQSSKSQYRWITKTDNELLELLRQKAMRMKRSPRAVDMKADDNVPSANCYVARFRSWNNALFLAGLEPN